MAQFFLSLISKSTFLKFLKVFNLYFTMWTTTPVCYRRSTVRPGVHEDYVQTFILVRIWIFNWIGSRLELPRTFLSLLTHYCPLISDLKFDKSLIWCNSYVTSERCSLLPEKKNNNPFSLGVRLHFICTSSYQECVCRELIGEGWGSALNRSGVKLKRLTVWKILINLGRRATENNYR